MIFQSIKMAWQAIASNKMRSFLTMLGIIIGIIAIVVLVSLVTSASDTVTSQVESLGTNLVSVSVSDDKGHPLTLADIEKYTETGEYISEVAPLGTMMATAKRDTFTSDVTVYGTTSHLAVINGLDVEYGRFLKTADIKNESSVAVISPSVEEDLFGENSGIGQTLSIKGQSFLIVGVLKEDDSGLAAMLGNANKVYIPYTVESRMAKQPHVTTFYLRSENENDLEKAQKEVEQLLMQRFRQDEEAFSVRNQSKLLETMNTVYDTMALLLGGIAAISLLVGGIGIMNIMLVSVTERTREIGIRKAIGANRSSILFQFLIEALTVSLIGCLIGLLLSWGILRLVTTVAGDLIAFTMSPGVILLAIGFSVFIGVAFGMYPANKASKFHPIDALRYE
ncbi:MAG: ABC transporter permease [Christensenellales bacterium]